MNVRVGTSGYSYAEWKGNFYPEKMEDPLAGVLGKGFDMHAAIGAIEKRMKRAAEEA